MRNQKGKAVFTTGMAAKLTDTKEKTIINYDRAGLVNAKRTPKNRRLFSKKHLFRILLARELIKQHNLTYEAVKFVFSLIDKTDKDDIDLLPYIITDTQKEKFERKISI